MLIALILKLFFPLTLAVAKGWGGVSSLTKTITQRKGSLMSICSTGGVLPKLRNVENTTYTRQDLSSGTNGDRKILESIYALMSKGVCLNFIECFLDEIPCENTKCRHHLFYEKLRWKRCDNDLSRSMLNCCSFGINLVGPQTLEDISSLYALTRERMRQVELSAKRNLGIKVIAIKDLKNTFTPSDWDFYRENIVKKYDDFKHRENKK